MQQSSSLRKKNREFWAELLRSLGYGNLTALFANCVFLYIVSIALIKVENNENVNILMGYRYCSLHAQNWLFLNILAVIVLAAIQIIPENDLRKMNLSALDL